MNKTKIDWADRTWNPVTGCLHNCEYCYARKIANRFTRKNDKDCHDCTQPIDTRLHEQRRQHGSEYRYGFEPTFHPYRLKQPSCVKEPQNIFVCSMADLFGDWVPNTWIEEVFAAAEKAPQHNYLFLTKNPKRYADFLEQHPFIFSKKNIWLGYTQTGNDILCNGEEYEFEAAHIFVSIEPIRQPGWRVLDYIGWHNDGADKPDWVIVGAETGNRKDKVIPKKEWIMDIAEECKAADVPIFMKESLRQLMGKDFKQEYPEGLNANSD